ncbi:unnamed protein product [Kuraishia capsulata CBS 1993]|uniref:SWIRM domain-containing protein n=1 Tax=Kuraishia capsulata CBS 1993 TaxID=1382522 RepID=W6MUF4_9ASCO|nr:uncharacterized protein KUCA_T00001545001 [Kuraishia capsulata CBS 1993]CDK25575.1 unnamed protein product [Kuraishia capsulata CBS 1993]
MSDSETLTPSHGERPAEEFAVQEEPVAIEEELPQVETDAQNGALDELKTTEEEANENFDELINPAAEPQLEAEADVSVGEAVPDETGLLSPPNDQNPDPSESAIPPAVDPTSERDSPQETESVQPDAPEKGEEEGDHFQKDDEDVEMEDVGSVGEETDQIIKQEGGNGSVNPSIEQSLEPSVDQSAEQSVEPSVEPSEPSADPSRDPSLQPSVKGETDNGEEDEEREDVSMSGNELIEEQNGSAHITKRQVESDIPLEVVTQQTHTIVIPSYSAWFDMSRVHKIERQSLAEFFNGRNKNKTPQVYAKYRNFMINSYRLNPNEYLTYTVCRRNLIGDAATILRVHKFLTKWGLINYQVNPESRPIPVEPPFTGDYSVDIDTPRGLFPFQSYKPSTELPDLSKVRALLKEDEAKTPSKPDDNGSKESSARPLKRPRIAATNANSGWTEEDLKKLLEGVEEHKGDWNAISKHVGSHTPEQCILRFLQLPIEDSFLEEHPELLGPLRYAPKLPFSSTDNPVMSTVAFLTALVDPKVAAAASRRAVKVMDEELTKKLNDGKEEITKEEEEDPLIDIKDAAVTAMGIVGARSHMFATYEEREMSKIMSTIVNQQLNLVDIKLQQLTKLEGELELQKKKLERQQQTNFVDRLALTKSSLNVSTKLMSACDILSTDPERAKKLIEEAKAQLLSPPRRSLNILNLSNDTESDDNSKRDSKGDANGEEVLVKPVSFESPQLYRYWSG